MTGIKSFDEWARSPSFHGCYSDYVKHIEGVDRYHRTIEQNALAELIAEKIAHKLKGGK